LEKTAGIRIKHRDNTLIPSPPKLIGQRIFFRKEYILIQSLNYYSSVRIWVFPSLPLETGKAKPGFGETQKQSRRSAQGAAQWVRVMGKVRYLKQALSIPHTQNCYSFIRIISYPKPEPGLVITLG